MCSNFEDSKDWVVVGTSESSSLTENNKKKANGAGGEQTSTDGSTSAVPDDSNKDSCPPVSSSSSCCRICQESASGTPETLDTCKCQCKGQLSRVHRSCLNEWVRYRGSNRCEICGELFQDIPQPRTLGILQLEALEDLHQQLLLFRPITQRRRTALLGTIAFLLLVTGLTGILTISADQEFQRVTYDPSATNHDLKKAHIVFSISLSFLFFCVTLTLGLILIWLVVELFFFFHRRRLMRQAASRIARDLQLRRQMENTAELDTAL